MLRENKDNKELIAIVNEAIPLDPKCRINSMRAIHKRLWLMEKIKEYCEKQMKLIPVEQ